MNTKKNHFDYNFTSNGCSIGMNPYQIANKRSHFFFFFVCLSKNGSKLIKNIDNVLTRACQFRVMYAMSRFISKIVVYLICEREILMLLTSLE